MTDQFDDADEREIYSAQPTNAPVAQVLQHDAVAPPLLARIDDSILYSDSSEEDEDSDYVYSEEGENDAVNYQDWGDSAGDFTKRYNRLRQHANAVTDMQADDRPQGVMLPATNRPARVPAKAQVTAGSAPAGTHLSKIDSSLSSLAQRYATQVNLDPVFASAGATSTFGSGATRKGGNERSINKDKSDRATNEQVLDPRTRLVLFKMLGRGLLSKVEGCVSTGKEANVYHALSGDMQMALSTDTPSSMAASNPVAVLPPHLAIKIYKTSILTFKDRDRYVTGEYRFKGGYSRSNPRKMVRLWAEKELRNLRRLHAAGLRCPDPIEVRNNVLVMSFLGEGGNTWQAAPRLKDAELLESQIQSLYIEMLSMMRTIFKKCRLVHADLSEYNILYHQGHLWVIDVSQSVEQDHPHAFDFLRSDIKNVDEFFSRRNVATLGVKSTFDLVTGSWGKDGDETEEDIAKEVERILSLPQATAINGEALDKSQTDAVFAQSYIPRQLIEVYDAERDVAAVLSGKGEDLIYASTSGLAPNKATQSNGAAVEIEEEAASEEDSSSSEGESDEDDAESRFDKKPRGKKFEDKADKKDRKQAVKDEKKEKRKTKMPKSEKRRRVAKGSSKK